jgi:hypothetical protein
MRDGCAGVAAVRRLLRTAIKSQELAFCQLTEKTLSGPKRQEAGFCRYAYEKPGF